MSKNKTEDLLSKIISRKQKEVETEEKQVMEGLLPNTAYDIRRIPGKGNSFELVVINYNPDTNVAVVAEKIEANGNKVVAMRFCDVDKRSLETLFLKKKENK